MSHEAPDPSFEALRAQLSRELGPGPESTAFLHAVTVPRIYPKETVCWVVVRGINLPIPITRRTERASGDVREAHIRVPLPGTNGLYLQYTPEVGLDRIPGACLHYTDYQGRLQTPMPSRDAVWYEMERRLPFAPERLARGTRIVACRAFHTEAEAKAALLKTSR